MQNGARLPRSRMRCFLAIPLGAEVQSALEQMSCRLRSHPWAGRLRWVPAEQWHITLAFLGELSPEKAGELRKKLAEGFREAALGAFALRSRAPCFFPHQGCRPRLLVLPVEPVPPLLRAAAVARRAAAHCGLVLEERRYWPHVTLARLRSGHRAEPLPSQRLDSEAGVTVEIFCSVAVLYESRLSHAGAEHRVLAEFGF